MARFLNGALAAVVLFHTANASMNPLMLSKTAMLKSTRKTSHVSDLSSMPMGSSVTSIDEWYDDGCDELLEASTSTMSSFDTNNGKDEKEVAMCSVSRTKESSMLKSTSSFFFSSFQQTPYNLISQPTHKNID
jgi:hypothetical protein